MYRKYFHFYSRFTGMKILNHNRTEEENVLDVFNYVVTRD